MLDPHFIIAEGFKLIKTRKMKTQPKTKEERFERVITYREGQDTFVMVLIASILLFPITCIFGGIIIIRDILSDRKVYWRKVK
jgi:hypothetical protein